MDSPAVTAAAACSPSGSTNISGRPEMLRCPLAADSAHCSPIWVDGVIGYAPAASVDSRSHSETAVFPSTAVRTPGNRKGDDALIVPRADGTFFLQRLNCFATAQLVFPKMQRMCPKERQRGRIRNSVGRRTLGGSKHQPDSRFTSLLRAMARAESPGVPTDPFWGRIRDPTIRLLPWGSGALTRLSTAAHRD